MSLLDDMVLHFHIGPTDLMRIILTAPKRYKEYTIPKRHGGLRLIAQPSRELKALQRYLLEFKLNAFPVHSAATGYVSGKNIFDNAQAHRDNKVILKLDFEDFFPNIRTTDWNNLCRRHPGIVERGDMRWYRLILFWGRRTFHPQCLSIGAPTSPALSNIVMFEIDTLLAAAANRTGVTYTRYADDITASANTIEDVRRFEAEVTRILRATKSPNLTLNQSKRGIYLKGQRRMVTGLIITPDKKISIGRERKRLISVMLHKVLLGSLDTDHTQYLKGILGFCVANEPEFVTRMRAKYGSPVVDRVLQFESS